MIFQTLSALQASKGVFQVTYCVTLYVNPAWHSHSPLASNPLDPLLCGAGGATGGGVRGSVQSCQKEGSLRKSCSSLTPPTPFALQSERHIRGAFPATTGIFMCTDIGAFLAPIRPSVQLALPIFLAIVYPRNVWGHLF